MGLSLVHSRGCAGVEAPLITVEVHLSGGLPSMHLVGLPETAVRESKDRVRAALINSGFKWPQSRITISLAPAELPKEGGGFDLPIALGILAASEQIPNTRFDDCEFLGELSLNGELRSVRGVLPAAIRSRDSNRTLIIPDCNSAEAALVKGGEKYCGASLLEIANWINGGQQLEPCEYQSCGKPPELPDLCDVIGLPGPKRALEVAAAGGHHLLMAGPPGTGKTLLASRLPGILPPMTESESLEVAALASVSYAGLDHRLWGIRPFRTPHHSCSSVALAGGGSRPRPGEISLAHNGVLFLDELPEYGRHTLEILREPIESGCIVISRAVRQARFPARFQLVAAMNPCPCGMSGDDSGRCNCSGEQIQRYKNRVSGPLLDRIDIQVEVLRPKNSILSTSTDSIETSEIVRGRVITSRQTQIERAGKANAMLTNSELRQFCHIENQNLQLLEQAAEQLYLSPRACHRILKVARTIADLDQATNIESRHLAEAIAFRRLSLAMDVV
ncbi:MAG: YifB family Mg chelatase-like AAA ATPase [Xanthomonadales bacterium]|nr:YifB family Mg chelatase-like AAA ATPase [Xanthomonadales bacterium]